MLRRHIIGAAGALLPLSLARALPRQLVTRERIGKAVDATTGKLLYREQHEETWDNDVITADQVTYRDARGKRFASKQVRFDGNELMPQFRLEDERTGHLEALTRTDSGIRVAFREQRTDEVRSDELMPPADAMADAGFDRFIETHWDALLRGAPLTRPFLLPSRIAFYAFQMRLDSQDATTATFAMRVDSALMRLFAPTIRVAYSRRTRRLARYDGPSNLRDEGGNNYKVRVVFDS